MHAIYIIYSNLLYTYVQIKINISTSYYMHMIVYKQISYIRIRYRKRKH